MSNTIVDLIRHGEPVGGSLYRGHTIDDPLSDKGWQQMQQAVGSYNQWQQIITSPMTRCVDFAEQLAKQNNIPLQIEDNFKEVGFGSWEGLTREQVKQKNIEEYNNFYRDPVNCRGEGFEDLNNFISRVTKTYETVTKQFSGKNILIVAHAGVIRAILANIVGAPPAGLYNFRIKNAAISRINAGSNEIEFVNKLPIE